MRGVGYPEDYATGPVPGTAPLRPRGCPGGASTPWLAVPGRAPRGPSTPRPAVPLSPTPLPAPTERGAQAAATQTSVPRRSAFPAAPRRRHVCFGRKRKRRGPRGVRDRKRRRGPGGGMAGLSVRDPAVDRSLRSVFGERRGDGPGWEGAGGSAEPSPPFGAGVRAALGLRAERPPPSLFYSGEHPVRSHRGAAEGHFLRGWARGQL